MLRLNRTVRHLVRGEEHVALAACAEDPGANVFPASRIAEHGVDSPYGKVLVHERPDGAGLLWFGANVVPIRMAPADVEPFAARLRRSRYRSSSIFGPADQVLPLWNALGGAWGPARDVRRSQPLLTATDVPASLTPDPAVRRARRDELDILVPAAAAMFTEEIGYPPYPGSDDRGYRSAVGGLVDAGRAFVRVEEGRVVFKADVGSVAGGVAQVQGVWVAPEHRGRGLAAPAMAAVDAIVLREIAPSVNLYVNDYNVRARRVYERVGYVQTGTFATVLL